MHGLQQKMMQKEDVRSRITNRVEIGCVVNKG